VFAIADGPEVGQGKIRQETEDRGGVALDTECETLSGDDLGGRHSVDDRKTIAGAALDPNKRSSPATSLTGSDR
jgi:hypothetical protein